MKMEEILTIFLQTSNIFAKEKKGLFFQAGRMSQQTIFKIWVEQFSLNFGKW